MATVGAAAPGGGGGSPPKRPTHQKESGCNGKYNKKRNSQELDQDQPSDDENVDISALTPRARQARAERIGRKAIEEYLKRPKHGQRTAEEAERLARLRSKHYKPSDATLSTMGRALGSHCRVNQVPQQQQEQAPAPVAQEQALEALPEEGDGMEVGEPGEHPGPTLDYQQPQQMGFQQMGFQEQPEAVGIHAPALQHHTEGAGALALLQSQQLLPFQAGMPGGIVIVNNNNIINNTYNYPPPPPSPLPAQQAPAEVLEVTLDEAIDLIQGELNWAQTALNDLTTQVAAHRAANALENDAPDKDDGDDEDDDDGGDEDEIESDDDDDVE